MRVKDDRAKTYCNTQEAVGGDFRLVESAAVGGGSSLVSRCSKFLLAVCSRFVERLGGAWGSASFVRKDMKTGIVVLIKLLRI